MVENFEKIPLCFLFGNFFEIKLTTFAPNIFSKKDVEWPYLNLYPLYIRRRCMRMAKTLFDPESYERDLAMMMLDVLVNKNEISFGTYRAAKKNLMSEEEEYGKLRTGRTANATG